MLDAMTWLSIGVLIVGSLIVFVWFVFDAGRILGGEDTGGGIVHTEDTEATEGEDTG